VRAKVLNNDLEGGYQGRNAGKVAVAPQLPPIKMVERRGGDLRGRAAPHDSFRGAQITGTARFVDAASHPCSAGRATYRVVQSNPRSACRRQQFLVAGDLVFFGEGNGKFHAVDAATGKMLFTFDGTSVPNGSGAQAAPVAYVVGGKEFVVNAFGGNVPDRQFAPNPVGDAIIAFSIR
jgi:hypothetical protein